MTTASAKSPIEDIKPQRYAMTDCNKEKTFFLQILGSVLELDVRPGRWSYPNGPGLHLQGTSLHGRGPQACHYQSGK